MSDAKREHKASIGRQGEDIACTFLKRKGFSVISRNYQRKWGEIDIVAEKKGILHFIEVKTLTKNLTTPIVSRENNGVYRPEENVHRYKLARLRRVIQTYLLEEGSGEPEWQFDVLTVILDERKHEARINFLKDITL